MMAPWNRVTVIESRLGDITAQLIVIAHPTDNFQETITITSDKKIEVSATRFNFADYNPGRPVTIKLFIDGLDTGRFLIPTDFTTYAKILIDRDADGKLKIKGIKARWPDFGRIK